MPCCSRLSRRIRRIRPCTINSAAGSKRTGATTKRCSYTGRRSPRASTAAACIRASPICCCATGEKDAAIVEYEKAAQFNPADLDSQNNLATAYLEKGRVADAERVFRWILTNDNDYAAAQNGMGLMSIQKQDPNAARGYFERAVQLDPDLVEAQMNLGHSLRNGGRPCACAGEFRDVPGESLARPIRATSFRGFGRNSRSCSRPMLFAAIAIQFLLAQSVQIPHACDAVQSATLASEARQAASARNFPMAAMQFQAAYDACPQNGGLLLEAANALFMARRFADAKTACDEMLAGDPANAAALKIKGNAEYFLGAFDQAISTFVTLLDRHPADEDGAYMLGRIYYQEGRTEQAIGQFERVLKLNPRAYKAWDNLGLCWQASGDPDKAVKYFLQAIKIADKDNPQYDWAYANLADLAVEDR